MKVAAVRVCYDRFAEDLKSQVPAQCSKGIGKVDVTHWTFSQEAHGAKAGWEASGFPDLPAK